MAEEVALKKNLNVIGCVSFLISIVVGSGIFIVPNAVLRDSGSVGLMLLVWFLGGVLYALFGALSYAELGCLLPKTGGEYVYIKAAFHDIFGFMFVWGFTFIFNPAVCAFAGLLFSDYALKIFYPTCSSPDEVRLALALASILMISLLNCIDAKVGQALGMLFNFGKIVGIVMIICIGIYGLVIGRVESFKNPFENSVTDISTLAIAFNGGCFSYNGWNGLNNLVGEMKNPNRTFPISIFGGLTIIIFIYVSVNAAYLTFLSPIEMIASNAVAFSFVDKFNPAISWSISIFVCLSGLGFINGITVFASRFVFAAAEHNHMPSVFGMINLKYNSPLLAVCFTTIMPCIFVILRDMNILLNIAMLLTYIVNITCTLALFRLRYKMPDAPRPFKVNLFFPIVFLITCCFLSIMICYTFALESALCVGFLASSIPVYMVTRMKKSKSFEKTMNNIKICLQKLTLSAPTEKNE